MPRSQPALSDPGFYRVHIIRVHCGDADGMVSGAIHTTAATVRPAMQVLKSNSMRVSSVFFMCLSDRVLVYGERRGCACRISQPVRIRIVRRTSRVRTSKIFPATTGDCAVNMNPSAEELAQIAIESADTAKAFGVEPRVAMLSYSTLGSGEGPDVSL